MSAAEFARFRGIQGGMNSAKDHPRAALSRHFTDFVSTQSICSMNADSDDISVLNAGRVHLKQRLIHKNGIAKAFWSCTGKHVLPAGSDDRSPKRHGARIDQVHIHPCTPIRLLFCEYAYRKLRRARV